LVLRLHLANDLDYEVSQQFPPTIGSLQSVAKARSWLEACARSDNTYYEDSESHSISSDSQDLGERYHAPCTHYSTLEYVPTRLLDLRNITSGTWRICVPSEDSTSVVAYATISYCWGAMPFLKLTQQLLPDFRAGQPVSQLPQVFQDAIMVTKHLGLQYIWIDALCIIQDSEEDFKNEAAKMAEVYSNTVINIIAAACQSPFESLFKARDLRSCHVGRFWPSWDTTDSFFATLHSVDSIMEIESIKRDFENASTSRRGWILQERILPSRRLYFFRTQLYYVCRSSEACEVFPDVVPDRLKSYSETHDLPLPSQQQSPFHNWNFLAEEYSKCSLTYPGDKIIALSGLVRAFQIATGDDYVAGLWKSQLPWTLGWSGSAYSHRRRSALDIAPTWSWLSIEGEINLGDTGLLCTHKTAICDILDVSVVPAHAISTNTVVLGVLTLRAPLFLVCVAVDGSLNTPFFSEDLVETARFSPDDTYDELTAGTRLVMAILTVEGVCEKYLNTKRHIMEGATWWTITALILQHDEVKDWYRRVGNLSIKTKTSHSQVKKSQLLEELGLMIKDAFGEVIVTDDSKWTVLRII
jgi:hypothetical protein